MRRTSMLTLAAAVWLSACSETPVDPADDAPIAEAIVITQGVAAPPFQWRPRVAWSILSNAVPSLGGSTTSAVSINGTACSEFPVQPVTISYTLSGNQASPASFMVNTKWDYDGSTFVGSEPTTVSLPAKTGGGEVTHMVGITIENSAEAGNGATTFVVAPFGLVTNLSDPSGQRLGLDVTSSATIHVAFNDCTPINTPPWVTVPSDITVEATGPSGAAVEFSVTAEDTEDDEADLTIECTPTSGSTFPLGTTIVTCIARDTGGLESDPASFNIHVVDTTPPAFSGLPNGQVTLIAEDASGATYDASGITATDLVDGPVSVTCAPLHFSIGELGTVTCSASDTRDNAAMVYVDVLVTLDFAAGAGFLAPLRMTVPFSAHKLGSTVPHKFLAPAYADGTLATDLAGLLRLVLTPDGGTEEDVVVVDQDYSAGSTEWRYDPEAQQYIFNLKSAKNWMTGSWITTVSIGAVKLAETELQFRK